MANMFERPIAAQPLSEFNALPLQFIDSMLQRRQQKADVAKAEIGMIEDELAKTSALPGDAKRHQEIMQEYDTMLNDIVESVGDDYSRVGPSLDRMKRKIKGDLGYGELGGINKNYVLGMKYQEEQNKLFQDAKIGQGGHAKTRQSVYGWQTKKRADGGYESFTGYTASNVADPMKAIYESVKEVVAQYKEDGTKNVSPSRVMDNVNRKLESNPEILKAMGETFSMSYTGPESEKEAAFAKFYKDTVLGIVSDRTYEEKLKDTEKGADKQMMPGARYTGGTIPITGDSEYRGGGAAWLRQFFGKGNWVNAQGEFDSYVNSKEGDDEIKYLEKKTGTKFPTNYADRVDWLEQNLNESKTADLVMEGISKRASEYAVTDKGYFNRKAAVRNFTTGEILKDDDLKNIQGNDDTGKVTRAVGKVGIGSPYLYGSIVIEGKDGETYIQEPTDPEVLMSKEYAASVLGQAKFVPNGRKKVELRSSVKIGEDKDGAPVILPAGEYFTVYDLDSGSTQVKRNGKLVYGVAPDGSIAQF